MKETIPADNFLPERGDQIELSLSKSHKRWTSTLLFSSTLGVLTGLCGLFINVFSLFGLLENNPRLGQIGVWLLVVAFPLGALSAHCIDKIDETEKVIRIERYRKHGTPDGDWR